MLDLPPQSDFLRLATQQVFATVIQESERQLKDLRPTLNWLYASIINEAYRRHYWFLVWPLKDKS